MNVLITNSVPLNGGDEAVLRAIVESLKLRWPNIQITVLCNKVSLSKQYLPDLTLASDLEFARTSSERREVSELYRNADVVLASPGGYLHDFYPIEDRLRALEVALALGKPVILLPQSIGPFWKDDSTRRIAEVLNRVSSICVRDQTSIDHLLNTGVRASRIVDTADAAFLWHKLAPELFQPKDKPIRTVGLCFRVWPLDDQVRVNQTIHKATALCRFLLSDPSRDLVFISTCQGIGGYIDDSALAEQIVAQLPRDLQLRSRIDHLRYSPRERIQALGRCDAVIGMRLHACLLAMLGGTPAMGLGYEQKTAEIFRQLNLEAYQISFEEEADSWLHCAQRFIDDAEIIRSTLPDALERLSERANISLEIIEKHTTSPMNRGAVAAVSGQPNSEWTQLVDSYAVPHLRLRQVAALINRLKPSQIVDLGCATGALHQLCPGIEYIGCDFVAPTRATEFPFSQCNFNQQNLPVDLTDLELIVCSGILEYIEDLPGFLSEVRSRLRHDGHLVATYFNMNHFSRIWELVRGKSFAVRPDWRGFYSPQEFAKILRDSGFRLNQSVAMNHSLREPVAVEETLDIPLALPRARRWSALLSHQFIFVARCDPDSALASPVQTISSLVPREHSFILVDEEQWADEVFTDRRAIPFLERDGEYWGPPADDKTAIRELDRLRRAGASFMVFARPAFWWLEYYSGLHRHLRLNFRCVLKDERLVVFDLRP